MSGSLVIRNQQRGQRVDTRLLRKIIRSLLQEELGHDEFEVGLYLVGESEMARLNQTYLHHQGSTDVITFDYCDPETPEKLQGEIFVCLPVAAQQARRFRTTWQQEVVRYAIHGVLHLLGYDDQEPVCRRQMKREENRLLKRLAIRFRLDSISL